MSKTLTFVIFLVFLWCVVAGSPKDSQDNKRLVCLLEDQKDQWGSYCMFALKPLLDRIAKHQDQWSTSYSLSLNDTQAKLDRIEGHQEALEKTLRAAVEEKLNRMTRQQAVIISNLVAKLDTMETLCQKHFEVLEKKSKYIPPNFQKIAQRYFYIERNIKLNWFAASDTCRRMGGQLAIIENEEERQALVAKVNAPPDVGFWLDIHNLAKRFEYTSSATGNEAPFIKWGSGQPNIIEEDCIALDSGKMHDYNCGSKLFFICQA